MFLEILLFLFAIILFSMVDVIGYYIILNLDYTHPNWKYISYDQYTKWKESKRTKQKLINYRIIQTIIQLIIAFGLYTLASWPNAVMWLAIHFFGIHDLIYYVFIDQYRGLNTKRNMTWLWWTIFGALGNKYRTGKNLKLFSLIGLILSIIGIIIT